MSDLEIYGAFWKEGTTEEKTERYLYYSKFLGMGLDYIFGLVEYSIPSPKQDYATWYRKNKKDHIRTARKIKGNLKRLGIKIDKRIIEHTIRRIKGRLSEEQVGGINIIKSIFT